MEEPDLKKRLQVLEDIEAIRRLKFRYASLCDYGYQADELATLFTTDAVWEAGEPWGNFVGPAEIRDFFLTMPERVSFAIHALSNGQIDIDGSNAKAIWRTIIPASFIDRDQNKPHWMFCDYEDTYEKVSGTWLFSRVIVKVSHTFAHADGWQ
jgi:hypothetical protein